MTAAEPLEPSELAADTRTRLRRQRRRVVLVMVAAAVVLVVAVGVVVVQTWLVGPDLAVGSRHRVTVQVDHPCGSGSVVLYQIRYGGHVWWVDGSPPVALGSGTGGTLIIRRPPTSGAPVGPTDTTDTADLDVDGHLVALEGGGESGPLFSCPIAP